MGAFILLMPLFRVYTNYLHSLGYRYVWLEIAGAPISWFVQLSWPKTIGLQQNESDELMVTQLPPPLLLSKRPNSDHLILTRLAFLSSLHLDFVTSTTSCNRVSTCCYYSHGLPNLFYTLCSLLLPCCRSTTATDGRNTGLGGWIGWLYWWDAISFLSIFLLVQNILLRHGGIYQWLSLRLNYNRIMSQSQE